MNDAYTTSDLYEALERSSPDEGVAATTPHGTYTFNIVGVTVNDDGSATLRLEERK